MKMKVGFSLDEITVQRIDQMATETRREKSTIVDMAVELLAQQDEFSQLAPVAPTAPRPVTAYRKRTKLDVSKIRGVRKGVTSEVA